MLEEIVRSSMRHHATGFQDILAGRNDGKVRETEKILPDIFAVAMVVQTV
jgi:hypothetical protein